MSLLFALALSFPSGPEEPRRVLCLYDSVERIEPRHCEIHVYAEVVLNYLGLLCEYRDVNRELPDDAFMEPFRGVLTWFSDRTMKHGRRYWQWLERQLAAGRRVVILGELGATTDVPDEFINAGLKGLGLTYHARETDDRSVLEIVQRGPEVEFERSLDGDLRSYVHLKSDANNRVWLRVRRKDVPDSESDLVVVGPKGGLAWVTRHFDPYVDRDRWHLDPFRFFEEAFGLAGMPRPDLATAVGRRIYFCSVDGDGIGNRGQPGPDAGALAGDIAREQFIKKYDLPFSISVIGADLPQYAELAKTIFRLPNVEVASHGMLHPLVWSRRTLAYPGVFSLETEIDEAVAAVEAVSAPKKVKVFLWTGDCDPPPEAIDRVDALGIANLNGWDPGRPQNYEAVTNLRSVATPREGRFQFNARSISENHFTDLWTRNFFAYRNVLISYRASGAPRRTSPIHVYFHFYVVEQPGGREALREVFEYVKGQAVFPMTASEYVAWARGFRTARLERLGPEDWVVRDYGACRTLRFDGDVGVPQLSRCRGVRGFRRDGNALYVHLDAGPEARLAMGKSEPDVPYLMEANGHWEGGAVESWSAPDGTWMTPQGPKPLPAGRRRREGP